jgi:hypothetical protein
MIIGSARIRDVGARTIVQEVLGSIPMPGGGGRWRRAWIALLLASLAGLTLTGQSILPVCRRCCRRLVAGLCLVRPPARRQARADCARP